MSEWNCLDSDTRIKVWRQFRNDISSKNSKELVTDIASFFSNMPAGARCVDYYTPASWPTPWEILYDGLYCENTISLMMYYTFILVSDEKADIYVIEDNANCQLVPIINDRYMLNYYKGELVDMCNDGVNGFSIMEKYSRSDIMNII